jgi:hypothetical protein
MWPKILPARSWPVLALLLCGCTDGATRLADDLRDAAAKLRTSGASHLEMTHVPRAQPEGCAKAYSLLMAPRSSIVIWCRPAPGEPPTRSYTTTYHLNFVQVPIRHEVDKRQGESTTIDLEMQGGNVIVSSVR